jgi:hypothetical protein
MSRRIKIVACLTLLCLVALAFMSLSRGCAARLMGESESMQISAKTRHSGTVEVLLRQHNGFYLDGGHAIGFGSAKEWFELRFELNGARYEWAGPGVPLILEVESGLPLIVSFDRVSDARKPSFRCYRWQGVWREVELKDYPKSLAMGNLVQMDPFAMYPTERPEFAGSWLAQFWYCLSKDIQYWQVDEQEIPVSFLHEYERQWKVIRTSK